ncbi:MAG TPA: hypothetical protein PLS95_05085 [Thermoanaerobaculales bacterium]|nr:hypothetical protein [Thermoanaerobaculales bacterium]HQN96745.1 hypothetical protein [Thermoanaerobaculales bacterium]HQP43209.1 hypothetical protein [Thermoanaerobaculales bacterium]
MKPAILTAISLILCTLPAAAETIDEVVAAVGDTPILRSDLHLAELVRLVDPGPAETAEDLGARLLEARIRLELQFRDLEASGTLYRLDIDVAASRATLVERAGGEEAVAPALAASGLTAADLDELALRVAAVGAFIEQRLRPRVRVGTEEVRAAYQELVARPIEGAGETAPPFEEVQEQLHLLLAERKLNGEIERWLDAAAEQLEVTRFHRW